ncbi:TIGR03086 family metal-binding protein [Streptomyces xiaopingdaonensis]|uniref:TIGR03086 family metal-binding protein n=1 Tax=Streptomyces xiaopingdaonensis TaxID=1565415 RepID=UPI000305A789|nr:TIGR03086 family metal-binding protein [Streptomyces xiaopingdaonensis]
MTDETLANLRDAARSAVPVVQGVHDGQLGAPTPCADYDVRALLNHLFHVVVSFQALAVKGQADFSSTPDRLGAEWRDRYAVESDALVRAWSSDSALRGESPVMRMPQGFVATQALADLTLHAWDLARATGRPYAPPPGAVRELLPALREAAPMARQAGVFGPEVATAPDAAEFARLLGVAGRDLAWRP